MPERIQQLIAKLRKGLGRIYGPRLKGVYLFGSYARGDQNSESDVDVLIVLNDYTSYGTEVDRTSEYVSDLSLQYALSISTIFLRESEWQYGDTPLLRNVRLEAIPA